MGLLSWVMRRRVPGGFIAGCGIEKWWLEALTEADRRRVRGKKEDIDQGKPTTGHIGADAKAALANLATWFMKNEERHIGRGLMALAETRSASRRLSVIDRHFMLGDMIDFYYRCRNDGPEYLPLVEERCRDMIALAPRAAKALMDEDRRNYKAWGLKRVPELPGHGGYWRLMFLLKKRGELAEAAKLEAEMIK